MNRLVAFNQQQALEWLAGLKWDWQVPLQVEWKQYRKKRSINQNSLSWMWYKEISDFLIEKGPKHYAKWDSQEAHDMCCHTWLGYEEREYTDMVTGEITVKEELRGTSDLDTGAMTLFLDQVYFYWMEKGLMLKIPVACEYQKYKEMQDG